MKKIISALLILVSITVMQAEPIRVGDNAPNIVVTLDDGTTEDLGTLFQEGPVLVYFYPKSFTGGCTTQACNLRDNASGIDNADITVFGVSADDVDTQKRFREEHQLPFHLVADTELELTKAFGVPTNPRGFPKRQSFILKGGKVVWRDLAAAPSTQAEDAIKAVQDIEE